MRRGSKEGGGVKGTMKRSLEGDMDRLKGEIINAIYPVGSIYISVSSTSPETMFGGTWEQIKGRFLLACGDNGDGWNYSPGSIGGEPVHTLTVNEMPSHNHGITAKGVNSGASTSSKPGNYPIDIDQDKESNWNVNTITIGYKGGSAAHNNMPPYLTVWVWKRVA